MNLKDLPDDILNTLRDLNLGTVADELIANADKPETNIYLDQLITQDERMLKLKDYVLKLIPHNDPVLIRGETGTGKELIARALHGKKPINRFVALNCAGMPEQLIESELFGHVKGAFTGADKDKIGLMQKAIGGTLFLDEVGELNMQMQAKLLRVLQEKTIRRVGGSDEIGIKETRIVSATHCELTEDKFRQDLFYRLSTFELVTIPLSDRLEDVPLIIKALDTENRIVDINQFCIGIDLKLKGNVRKLQQLIRRYYVLGEMPIIEN